LHSEGIGGILIDAPHSPSTAPIERVFKVINDTVGTKS